MGDCVYLDETCRVPRHTITHSCKSDGTGDGTSISLLNISLRREVSHAIQTYLECHLSNNISRLQLKRQ